MNISTIQYYSQDILSIEILVQNDSMQSQWKPHHYFSAIVKHGLPPELDPNVAGANCPSAVYLPGVEHIPQCENVNKRIEQPPERDLCRDSQRSSQLDIGLSFLLR